MKIVCKKCNGEFEPENDMLEESYLGAMITETYFNCPYCNKKYLVCINSKITRKLIKQIKVYTAIGDIEKVNKIRKDLKIEMDRLNGKVLNN
ncbi:hypothetical protein [Clostridium chauvoei]|uniref:Uncharacterized protein n=2 Tax=Clostridium chauvoei TaxID=46867 RepID=S6ESB8_9CLOT|nr:hypothetical protein [Clostridium chauvoei]ATD55414.1 hypothetical protein BTM20_09250 [Clostridium chauvoei]ATD56914.1 hypothetical protein BTM21_03790 [Clostridium chauvoei]MBX7280756.1 hypothetical protein [Clostridium chauvoei]MBX7283239.1 hypothetical protein [Clostridium chauvoei]MBX7285876.1 hypothetical protein [Clostridium chauvoei]